MSLDLAQLKKVRHLGGKIEAQCPACAAVGEDRAGNHLVVFDTGKFACIKHEGDPEHRKEVFALVGIRDDPPSANLNGDTKPWERPVLRTHDYHDASGNMIAQKVIHGRLPDGSKATSWRRPDPSAQSGWRWNLKGVSRPLPLFNLHQLVEAPSGTTVWIAEGEKDCESLARHDVLATTSPKGAHGKWEADYSEHFRDRTVIVCGDHDEQGRKHVEDVARSLHGIAASVRVVDWPQVWPTMPDKADATNALEEGMTVEDIEAVAVHWQPAGITKDTPAPATPPSDGEGSGSAADGIVEDLEPWDREVDLATLVEELEQRIQRHMVLPPEATRAAALWVVGSYVFDSFRIFPRMVVHSPEKRCGKTTFLEILHAMVPRGLLSSSISPAAVFRVIEEYRPTLLIDEADAFLKDNEPLRGIINSSHNKAGAFVIRCDGDKNAPRKFSTWAPIVIAGIQRVADTIMDRSIVIELQRKGAGDTVERVPTDLAEILLPLRRKLTKWAQGSANRLRSAAPGLLDSTNDRAVDNWTPLFAVAEEMGDGWAERGRNCFTVMCAKDESETTGTMLLADIREIFQARGVGKLWSCDIVHDLLDLDERPWERWDRGFTPRVLATKLGNYGIQSKQIKHGDKNKRGYDLASFQDAFNRYLPQS